MNGFSKLGLGFFSLTLVVATFGASEAEAARACRPTRTLKIGCTYNQCGSTVRFRMKVVALFKGYRIQFVDVRKLGSPEEALKKVDALLVPGGADINPSYYTEGLPNEVREVIEARSHLYIPSAEGDKRDPVEYALLKEYFSNEEHKDLPALGICRGMQMMSVSNGIPLYVDIRAELGIPNPRKRFQSFSTPGSHTIMDRVFPSGGKWGWKNHHQALRLDYFRAYSDRHPNVRVTALSNGGKIPEAMEFTDREHALGIQFHPESSSPGIAHKAFGWFLNEACERSKL